MKTKLRIIANSLTDPGVLFNVGNVGISLQYSMTAALINFFVAAVSFAVRAMSEAKAEGIVIVVPGVAGRKLNHMVENRGEALAMSGRLTLLAAVFALLAVFTKGADYGAAGMLGCFGLVHLLRGLATGIADSMKRRVMDAGGFFLAVAGYLSIYPTLPLVVEIAYAGVAVLASYLVFTKQSPRTWKQPDLYFALTGLAAAATAPQAEVALGFTLWACAYLSIDAMRKTGGVVQCAAQILRHR